MATLEEFLQVIVVLLLAINAILLYLTCITTIDFVYIVVLLLAITAILLYLTCITTIDFVCQEE